jgi:hypothetical protein
VATRDAAHHGDNQEEANPVSKGTAMWDSVTDSEHHLSHDLPCPRCGHAVHTYLACDEGCDCAPCEMPGTSLARVG